MEVADDVGEVEVVCVDEAADAEEDAGGKVLGLMSAWDRLGEGKGKGLPEAGEGEADWVFSCCLAELLYSSQSACRLADCYSVVVSAWLEGTWEGARELREAWLRSGRLTEESSDERSSSRCYSGIHGYHHKRECVMVLEN